MDLNRIKLKYKIFVKQFAQHQYQQYSFFELVKKVKGKNVIDMNLEIYKYILFINKKPSEGNILKHVKYFTELWKKIVKNNISEINIKKLKMKHIRVYEILKPLTEKMRIYVSFDNFYGNTFLNSCEHIFFNTVLNSKYTYFSLYKKINLNYEEKEFINNIENCLNNKITLYKYCNSYLNWLKKKETEKKSQYKRKIDEVIKNTKISINKIKESCININNHISEFEHKTHLILLQNFLVESDNDWINKTYCYKIKFIKSIFNNFITKLKIKNEFIAEYVRELIELYTSKTMIDSKVLEFEKKIAIEKNRYRQFEQLSNQNINKKTLDIENRVFNFFLYEEFNEYIKKKSILSIYYP